MNNVLVMLQTNSNQAYIYSSPRLREQIGASFQITLLSQWVAEEAKKLLEVAEEAKKLPEVAEEAKKLPEVAKEGSLPGSFWVSDSSGKVIVRLTGNDGEPKTLARNLVGAVTRRAFEKAPGLDVTGVFMSPEDEVGTHNGMTDDEAVTQDSLDTLDREFNTYSLNRPPAAARFPQLPFLERAKDSALPAVVPLSDQDSNAIIEYAKRLKITPPDPKAGSKTKAGIWAQTDRDQKTDEGGITLYSLPSRVKRAWARSARCKQIQQVALYWTSGGTALPADPDDLERLFQDGESDDFGSRNTESSAPLSTIGVIHIDGNGVGTVTRNLHSAFRAVMEGGGEAPGHDKKQDERTVQLRHQLELYRKPNPVTSSEAHSFQWFIMEINYRLDAVVNLAIAKSWKKVAELANDSTVPVVPILVGGDDVTVYAAGDYAIPFAEAYVRHYEELTDADPYLRQLAAVVNEKGSNTGPGPLTASAGIAIVGRNFPFHIAYDLAEKLVSRGKKLGKKKGEVQCSTLDFHILRDTTVLDPDDTLTEYRYRTQRPFLVGHYSEERITGTAHAEPGAADGSAGPSANGGQWKQVLRAVAAFNGQDPDQPGASLTDPFPRTRANRIIKLLAKGDEGKALSEWNDALKNTSAAQRLYDELSKLPPRVPPKDTSASHGHKESEAVNAPASTPDAVAPAEPSSQAEETPSSDSSTALEHVKWLLDILDLAENLPAGYVQSYSALHETGLGKDAASTSGEPEAPRPNDDPRSTPSPDEGASK